MLTLEQIFEKQLTITEEVLTEDQKESAFFVANAIFFDEVSVFLSIDDAKDYNEQLEQLRNKLGDFEVIERWVDKIEIVPSDYEDFKLPQKYLADYLMVCESVILTTSLKNLNMLKNVGIDEGIQQIPIDYQSIRELLRKRHNIGQNSYIASEEQ